MIGSQLRWEGAPLDIRTALDATRMILGQSASVDVRCCDTSLMPEIGERFGASEAVAPVDGLVWIDPVEGERSTLAIPESCARVVIILRRSRRSLVPGRGVGVWIRGAGFVQVERYGVHSPVSIVLFRIGRLFAWVGRLDLADRLRHRSQRAFVMSGWLARLSMVQVLVASRGHDED